MQLQCGTTPPNLILNSFCSTIPKHHKTHPANIQHSKSYSANIQNTHSIRSLQIRKSCTTTYSEDTRMFPKHTSNITFPQHPCLTTWASSRHPSTKQFQGGWNRLALRFFWENPAFKTQQRKYIVDSTYKKHEAMHWWNLLIYVGSTLCWFKSDR